MNDSELISEFERTGTMLYIAGFVFLGVTFVLGTLIIIDRFDHELVSNIPVVNQIVDSTYTVWDYFYNWFSSKPTGDLPPKTSDSLSRTISGSSINTITQGDYTSTPKIPLTTKDHLGCSYPNSS